MALMLNDGAGHFSPKVDFFDPGLAPIVYYGGFKPGDFDGDGDLDLVIDIVDGKNILFNESTACRASGSILREYWANVPGHNIKDIPLTTPPTSTDQLPSLRTRANVADNYAQRIRGYLCAPTSGNYTFFIQGDDKAELWLSSDNNPANKKLIASASVAWSWIDNVSQQSAPISLVGGASYYVEVLHKEAVGGETRSGLAGARPRWPMMPNPSSSLARSSRLLFPSRQPLLR